MNYISQDKQDWTDCQTKDISLGQNVGNFSKIQNIKSKSHNLIAMASLLKTLYSWNDGNSQILV